MNTYIRPSSDIFVKYLLGSEKNKDLLLSFINSVLTDSGFPKIVQIELKNPFNIKTFTLDKESILDLRATDDNGRQYDIEVQSTGNEKFSQRSLYYWAKLYVSQIKQKGKYTLLKPTICINVLDFILFPDLNPIHNCFLLREKDNPEYILTDHIVLHFLELPKIKIENLKTKLERWLYFLKNEGVEEDQMKILIQEDKDIAKAHQEYQHFTADDELRELYEARMKRQLDYNTDIEIAEKKGIEKEKIQTVMNMHKNDFDVPAIGLATNLSEEKIRSILKNMKKNETAE